MPERKEKRESFWKENKSNKNKKVSKKTKNDKLELKRTIPSRRKGKKK